MKSDPKTFVFAKQGTDYKSAPTEAEEKSLLVVIVVK